jgi:hypothetical protein
MWTVQGVMLCCHGGNPMRPVIEIREGDWHEYINFLLSCFMYQGWEGTRSLLVGTSPHLLWIRNGGHKFVVTSCSYFTASSSSTNDVFCYTRALNIFARLLSVFKSMNSFLTLLSLQVFWWTGLLELYGNWDTLCWGSMCPSVLCQWLDFSLTFPLQIRPSLHHIQHTLMAKYFYIAG